MGMFQRLKGAIVGSRGGAAPPADAAGDTDDTDDVESGDDDGFIPEAKAPGTILLRLVVVVLVAELAHTVSREQAGARDEAMALRRGVFDALVRLGLSPDALEAAERALAFGLRAGRVDPHAVAAAHWRIEAAPVLAWALGLRDTFPPAEEAADLAALRAAVPLDAGQLEHLAAGVAATVRPLDEWMVQRAVWMERMLPLLEQAPSVARSRTIERLRALLWLTDPGEEELAGVQVT